MAIVFVAVESLFGIAFPLTVWEDVLRGHRLGTGFIERWVDEILFYNFPARVFMAGYTLFAVLAAITWVTVPPVKSPRPCLRSR